MKFENTCPWRSLIVLIIALALGYAASGQTYLVKSYYDRDIEQFAPIEPCASVEIDKGTMTVNTCGTVTEFRIVMMGRQSSPTNGEGRHYRLTHKGMKYTAIFYPNASKGPTFVLGHDDDPDDTLILIFE